MDSTSCRVLLLLIFVLPAITAVGTQVVSYDNTRMLELIKQTEAVEDQLSLAAATWGKLRSDYPRDVPKIENFATTLAHVVCQSSKNITMQQLLQGYLLRENIRLHLATLNTTALFKEALQASDHEQGKWQTQIAKESEKLHCLFKPKQLRELVNTLVRRLYQLERGRQFAAYLYQLYMPGNRDSYELMVHAELLLFERYESAGLRPATYREYMAQLWEVIKREAFYASLPQKLKDRLIDVAISTLND
ncbi:uncharacterized protein LOC115630802 [Scaptodrosophila lebanonensis]|uniref:Uncharacterized protein LOC115630802 n=1 Tax=Drosophila lebanonensis TaxID=7225 RepID=A0A6J2U720_DROLE|nr:uncharacterized protein LOC115630802 [Scaptodrosophila lebanonensis]